MFINCNQSIILLFFVFKCDVMLFIYIFKKKVINNFYIHSYKTYIDRYIGKRIINIQNIEIIKQKIKK
jgi:hypothetical protein